MPSSAAETEEGMHAPSPPGELRKCSAFSSQLRVEVCGEGEQEPMDSEARVGCSGAAGPRVPSAALTKGTVRFHFLLSHIYWFPPTVLGGPLLTFRGRSPHYHGQSVPFSPPSLSRSPALSTSVEPLLCAGQVGPRGWRL